MNSMLSRGRPLISLLTIMLWEPKQIANLNHRNLLHRENRLDHALEHVPYGHCPHLLYAPSIEERLEYFVIVYHFILILCIEVNLGTRTTDQYSKNRRSPHPDKQKAQSLHSLMSVRNPHADLNKLKPSRTKTILLQINPNSSNRGSPISEWDSDSLLSLRSVMHLFLLFLETVSTSTHDDNQFSTSRTDLDRRI